MIKLKEFFSESEVETIETNKELCEGMSVNGNEVICFAILSDLLNGRQEISVIPNETLLTVYKQLSLYTEFWSEYPWFSNSTNQEITRKFKEIIKGTIIE